MHNYVKWKKSTVQATTVPHYIRWVSLFIMVTQKENGFTLEDVATFKEFLVRALYSPRNIQYGLHIIRDYLNYLIAVEGLDFPLYLFRVKQERSKSHYAITEEEYQAMLAVLPTYEPQPLQRSVMIRMLHDTGMRNGELLSLKLSDLRPREVVINNEKNKRQRLVGWSEETEKWLQKYLLLREGMITADPFLFVSFKWKPTRKLTTRQMERIIRDTCKLAKLDNPIRPHSFRHGFVHRKLYEGKPVTTVSQMLGHASAMNVINYAQLSSREIREAWGI